ncbi:hypothetical protein [Flavobacterium capsici]|uniref:OmpH family outer membrane protein n=1 Tax=Flavobacterium capsici TaxID=3075618 RepID=A0AA96J3K9_9FLAO|nr:hypothetical protein [Flavobacterium sp. PMR2A8]WNM19468.1 hypothetical protein RN608_02015 [Flavobacterium sp. PMR2A8]
MAVAFFSFQKNQKSIVFYDNDKVFSEFRMTKEIFNAGKKTLVAKEKTIDSLKNIITITSDENARKNLMKILIEVDNDKQIFKENFNIENSEKIWKRIDIYLKEYSTLKGYKLIISSKSSTGFYGDPEYEVTSDLLNFINNKYEGFN